jgi:hypothetical protein
MQHTELTVKAAGVLSIQTTRKRPNLLMSRISIQVLANDHSCGNHTVSYCHNSMHPKCNLVRQKASIQCNAFFKETFTINWLKLTFSRNSDVWWPSFLQYCIDCALWTKRLHQIFKQLTSCKRTTKGYYSAHLEVSVYQPDALRILISS